MSQQAALQEQEKSEDLKVEVRRVIKASRSRAFASWTTPELMQRWFAPGGMRVARAEVDLRVGGEYRIEMHGQDDAVVIVTGVYNRIIPDQLLSFTWRGECDAGQPSTVTVEFQDAENGTEVTIRHERFSSPEAAARHERGWNSCLEKLDRETADQG